eukprot:s1330_g16.t1
MDVDDWTARWNDRADREARSAMQLHGAALCALHRRLWEHHDRELYDLVALQALHLDVLQHSPEPIVAVDSADEADGEDGGEDRPQDWLVERGCPDSPNPFRALPLDTSSDPIRCSNALDESL